MTECKHEYVRNTSSWVSVCKHCSRTWNNITIDTLEAQRDELLAACEALLDKMAEADKDWCLLCERATGHDDWCACAIAKAAIANVKGGNDE